MSAPSPHTLLVHARALLVGRWTTHAPARNAAGTPLVLPAAPDAATFSLLGAVRRAAAREEVDMDSRTGLAAVKALRSALGNTQRGVEGAHREIADWCAVDGRTEAQVLEVLDRAIAATGRPQ